MNLDSLGRPKLESEWLHKKNQTRYMVYDITNGEAAEGRNDEYPVTVCYIGENGKKWSKPLANFLEKMEPVESRVPSMSDARKTPWVPYLSDYADGVKGHYAIARWNPQGYQEVWNLWSHKWGSASEDFLTYAEALSLLHSITLLERTIKCRPGALAHPLNVTGIGGEPEFQMPPLKINVTSNKDLKPKDGLWYFFNAADLDTDEAIEAIKKTMAEVPGPLAGMQTDAVLGRAKINWSRPLSAAERDNVANNGLNYVGPLAPNRVVIWGNRTVHNGVLPDLIAVTTLLHEVGKRAISLGQGGSNFDTAAWIALEQRAYEVVRHFSENRLIGPQAARSFHFSSRNCVLRLMLPMSAINGDAQSAFEVTISMDRGKLSINMTDDITNIINEVVPIDWILMG